MSEELKIDIQPEAIILKEILKPIEMKETHISYVFITEDHVYKLKKEVDFGFLDFRLKKYRKAYCLIEKELNSRFSDGIYEEVLKITKKNKEFTLMPYNNTMLTVDYVLKMKRIADENFLSYRIADGQIDLAKAESIGKAIAEKLDAIETPVEAAEENGGYTLIQQNCVENFDQTRGLCGNLIPENWFNYIEKQTLNFLKDNEELLKSRTEDGFIKDGHGDLRLEHVYFDGEKLGLIDCIEFNKRFRFCDVVSDFVFLTTELDQMGEPELSDAMMKGFLEVFPDENTRKLINFYKCYRAYVRLKVTSFLLAEKGEEWEGYADKKAEFDTLLRQSFAYAINMNTTTPLIFFGLMASGKSKNGKAFAKQFPVSYINTDVYRKQITGIDPETKVYVDFGSDIYSSETTQKVYESLGELANEKSAMGRMLIIDGSFSKHDFMTMFNTHYSGDIKKIRFTAPENVILDRLEKRKQKTTVSDGRPEIYEKQKNNFQDIGADLTIDTTGEVNQNLSDIMDFLT